MHQSNKHILWGRPQEPNQHCVGVVVGKIVGNETQAGACLPKAGKG